MGVEEVNAEASGDHVPDKVEVKVEEEPPKVEPVENVTSEVKAEVSNGSNEVSPLEKKIIRQIEYYFGDFNIVTDKFMQKQIKLDDGWVPLDVLITFNRLRNMSTDYEVIVNAMKKSDKKIVQISEDGLKMRRDPEKFLPERTPSTLQELRAKSVYIKGFPMDMNLDQLQEFFKDQTNVQKIYMRRKAVTNKFKGSIFLTFGTQEEAAEYMKTETPTYHGVELIREPSVEYHARKEIEIAKRKEEQQKRREMQRRKETQQQKKRTKAEESKEEGDDDEGKGQVKEGEEEDDDNTPVVEVKGSLLKLTQLAEKTTWEEIRKVLGHYAEIAFVDHSQGNDEAIVRFRKEGDAIIALDAASEGTDPKTVLIMDKESYMHVLEGDEEEDYWKKFKSRKKKPKSNHRGRRGGFRGRGNFRGGYRKRSGQDDWSGPPSKRGRMTAEDY